MKIKLGDVFILQQKSKIKAGEGLEFGKYKFFTSSIVQSKFINESQYNNEALIFGTGGNANIHYCNEPFSVSTDCIVVFGKNDINLKIIYYYLFFNIHLLQNGFRGAGLKHISKSYIFDILIDLPNKELQDKLVYIFDNIEKIIYNKNIQFKYFESLTQFRFIEMFKNTSNFLIEDLINNVEEMFIGPFGSNLKNECFVNKKNSFCMVYEQKHAIQKSMDVYTRYVDEKKYRELKRFEVNAGDIIVSCRGTVGEVYIIPHNAPIGIMHPSIMKIRVRKDIYNEVFFKFLIEKKFLKYNDKINGSGIKMAITAKYLGKEKFIVPPLSLQNEFADFVREVDKSKLAVKKSLEELEILKKSLMQKYFS